MVAFLVGDDNVTVMEIVGSATGLGIDERIYAVRFLGEKAYLNLQVTRYHILFLV